MPVGNVGELRLIRLRKRRAKPSAGVLTKSEQLRLAISKAKSVGPAGEPFCRLSDGTWSDCS